MTAAQFITFLVYCSVQDNLIGWKQFSNIQIWYCLDHVICCSVPWYHSLLIIFLLTLCQDRLASPKHTHKNSKGNDGGGSVDVERFSYQRPIEGILHQQKGLNSQESHLWETIDF